MEAKTKFFHLNAVNKVVGVTTGTLEEALAAARAWNRTETREPMIVELVSNNRNPVLATRIAGV